LPLTAAFANPVPNIIAAAAMTTTNVVFMLAFLINRHRFDAKRPLCSAAEGKLHGIE
jgi:hypothetical protein